MLKLPHYPFNYIVISMQTCLHTICNTAMNQLFFCILGTRNYSPAENNQCVLSSGDSIFDSINEVCHLFIDDVAQKKNRIFVLYEHIHILYDSGFGLIHKSCFCYGHKRTTWVKKSQTFSYNSNPFSWVYIQCSVHAKP